MLLGALACVTGIRRARPGRSMVAVRDNERAAAARGINVSRTKLAAFAVSGALAGLAGGLHAVVLDGVRAGSFTPAMGFEAFSMLVLGGATSLGGALTEAQRADLTVLQQASAKAVEMLKASCPSTEPITPPARLEAIANRLDTMLQAVKSVRAALDDFYGKLSDEQKAQFEAIGPGRSARAAFSDQPSTPNPPLG